MGITLEHATTKHAKFIGVLEGAHATKEPSLEMASSEYRKQWRKCLQLAILHYNISNHTSLRYETTRFFHGRVPYNILDYKLGLKTDPKFKVTTDIAVVKLL